MKLNTEEIYAIEKYLLEQDLISLEFYDEMLDHFITAIIDYKNQGFDFEKAFTETKSAFGSVKYSLWKGIQTHKGVKALELQRYDKVEKRIKKVTYWAPFNLLKSGGGLPWVLICLFIGLGYAFDGRGLFLLISAGLLGLLLSLAHFVYKARLLDFRFLLMRWNRFMITSLSKRKEIQLKSNYRLFLFLKGFHRVSIASTAYIFIAYQHLTFEVGTFGLNFYTARIAFAFLFVLIFTEHWLFFKKEYNKTISQKA